MTKPKKIILVVEDDLDLCKILVSGLSKFNYDVYQAADGEEAVNSILEVKPDLILLDLLLPKLDGFQVLERLRGYPDPKIAATKVVVLSNLYSSKDILMARALKIDEYFVKANTKLEDVYAKVEEIFKGPKM